MIIANPLKLDNIICRSHHIIGIYELNGKIVFLHSMLGDVPKEEITKDTIFPNYIIADFFAPDFNVHTQDVLIYPDKRVLYETCCECEPGKDSLVLNTMRYTPKGGIFTDNGRHNTLDKIIEIRDNFLFEIGESPDPTEKAHSDKKTYIFGDYAVYMASPFTMECCSKTTGTVIWKQKISAYLYTDIEEKNGMLYFGTAGKGGHFYGLSLQDGNVIFSYNTGGTVSYEWFGGNIFVTDRKGDVVLIDSKTGMELNRFVLKRFEADRQKLHAMPNMLIKEDKLYITAYSHSDFYDFYALCIDL